jgi:hypothetical protein
VTRTTDRECWAAIVRATATLNAINPDAPRLGVAFNPEGHHYGMAILSLMEVFKVPIRSYGTPSYDAGPRIGLEHCAQEYGGGVRPYICEAGKTSHSHIPWWPVSAGLGPGAVPRKQFVHILGAIEGLWQLLPQRARECSSTTITEGSSD